MCSKSTVVFCAVCLLAVLAFLLWPNRSLDDHGEAYPDSIPVEDIAVIESTKAADSDNGREQVEPGHAGKDDSPSASSMPALSGSAPTEADFDDPLVERELRQVQIIAEYGEPGATSLSEAAFRRHAEARYVERYDLNGDGKVDGAELRAMARDRNPAASGSRPSIRQ